MFREDIEQLLIVRKEGREKGRREERGKRIKGEKNKERDERWGRGSRKEMKEWEERRMVERKKVE